jgi:hypothetical protein
VAESDEIGQGPRQDVRSLSVRQASQDARWEFVEKVASTTTGVAAGRDRKESGGDQRSEDPNCIGDFPTANCTGIGTLNGCKLKSHSTTGLPYTITATRADFDVTGTIVLHNEYEREAIAGP